MRLLRGEAMDIEESNSMEDSDVGLMIPRPPSLAGRARRSRTRLFGGGLLKAVFQWVEESFDVRSGSA